MQDSEFGMPLATFVVPSIGSRAISNRGAPSRQVPTRSPLKSPGDSSLIPSPIVISPRMSMRSNMPRMASQAAASASSFCPLPSHWSVLSAAISVARRKSNSTCRSMSGNPVMVTSGWDRFTIRFSRRFGSHFF